MPYEQQQFQPYPSQPAEREQDMGSMLIGLVAGFILGLIGLAIVFFVGSKETRQDRLIGAGIGIVVAIVLMVVVSASKA